MFLYGNSECLISVFSINCTLCAFVIMTAPNECVQASGAKLLLTRTEAQAHLAPLICVRVYFLSKFIDLMPANILLWAGLVSIQITALKSSEFSPVGAVCYFTASQERLTALAT